MSELDATGASAATALADDRPAPQDPAWSRSLYLDLRRLACSLAPGRDESVRPTVLVHEAWVRMARAGAAAAPGQCEQRRRSFFALARRAMRSYLIDRSRRRKTRRGIAAIAQDPMERVAGPASAPATMERDGKLLAALARLSAIDPRKGRVVELRFLAGLSVAETARALGVSERTVELDWRGARAWLNRELTSAGDQMAS